MTPAAHRRRLRKIWGRLLFAAIFLVLFCAGLSLVLNDGSEDLVSPPTSGPGVNSIVALRGGQTLVAPQGTVGRDIVEWLDVGQPGQHYFELGGNQFQGDTAEPTDESVARLDRLAIMLEANRDVSVRIIGHEPPALAPGLAGQRVLRVRNALIARGVAPRRLTGTDHDDPGRISSQPVRDGRVAILLSRGRMAADRPVMDTEERSRR